MWNKMMHAMVYSCDKATFLLTKAEYTPLSFLDRMRLKIHLMGCEFCRLYQKHNAFITEQYSIQKLDATKLKLREEKKKEIRELIENQSH
jgi:hypothetical protein